MAYESSEIDDEKPEFESGDQDYESAYDWDPQRDALEKIRAEAVKKDPRAFARPPEMLSVERAQYFVRTGAMDGPMKPLFGPFWSMGELAILFSPPGVGKSVLATQIAECVARGIHLSPFAAAAGREPGPQRVLYIDFEMNRSQFSQRYAVVGADSKSFEDLYEFSPELLRSEMYWDGRTIEGYEDFTDMLFEDIARQIAEHEVNVLIIDNVSYLTRGSTADATSAFRLMYRLQEMRTHRFVSILVIAHTPKSPHHGPITGNEMQGSVDLSKGADSVIALSRSRRLPDLRYLKQVKCRSGPIVHGEDNVALFRIGRIDLASRMKTGSAAVRRDNFLGFDFVGFDTEEEHYTLRTEESRRMTRRARRDKWTLRRAKALAADGLSTAAVALELGVSRATAHRYMTQDKRKANL